MHRNRSTGKPLAEKLEALGIQETERNFANKISRGGLLRRSSFNA
jgi:hypothetical protein